MKLYIVRNPDSKLLDFLDMDSKNHKVVLVQNGVYSEALTAKGASVLADDAKARNLTVADDKKINYDGLLDAVFESDGVLVI